MKLVVMCPRFPYPLEKGDKLRMYHQLRFLSKNHSILLIALTDTPISDDDKAEVASMVDELKIFPISKWKRAKSLILSLFSKLPFQVAYYYDKLIAKEINKAIEAFKPDHIYCQLVRMAEYVKDQPYPKTLDYMDAFGIGMARRGAVVNFILAQVYKEESKRLIRYERQIYHSFDHKTIISEQDNEQIIDKPITIIPNGIDTLYFSPLEKENTYEIGFVGNMGYTPNIDAVEYLILKVKPCLPPEFSFLIAGARPDKRVKQLASEQVTITGWMDDVRDAYATTRIFVAPLWQGTGQQNKILEAMAMGTPCVTTDSVNNAIGAKPEKEILIANNEEDFARQILKLANDPKTYSVIKNNALTFVRQNYSWEESVHKLENLFLTKKMKK